MKEPLEAERSALTADITQHLDDAGLRAHPEGVAALPDAETSFNITVDESVSHKSEYVRVDIDLPGFVISLAAENDAHSLASLYIPWYLSNTPTGPLWDPDKDLERLIDYMAYAYKRGLRQKNSRIVKATELSTGRLAGFATWRTPKAEEDEAISSPKNLDTPAKNADSEIAAAVDTITTPPEPVIEPTRPAPRLLDEKLAYTVQIKGAMQRHVGSRTCWSKSHQSHRVTKGKRSACVAILAIRD